MSNDHQKQLGKTLWNIADQLRGARNWGGTTPTPMQWATAAGRRCRCGMTKTQAM